MTNDAKVSTSLFGKLPLDPRHIWPTDAQLMTNDQKQLNAYKRANFRRSLTNKNELWMKGKLKVATSYKWTPQARWGRRIFDFWCAKIGVAVEVDGPEHKADYDALRDKINFLRSGIVILRVRNRNEEDAECALDHIKRECLWTDRREVLGLSVKGINTRWLRLQMRRHGDLQFAVEKVCNAGLYCSYAQAHGIRQSSSWIWEHNPKGRQAYQSDLI